MTPIRYQPIQAFDQSKHKMDAIAKKYLQKASDDVHDLVPVDVGKDGNCLYHSVVVFISDPAITAEELRGIFFHHAALQLK